MDNAASRPKTTGTRRKPKGRFGGSNTSRSHHQEPLVFDRVDENADSSQVNSTTHPPPVATNQKPNPMHRHSNRGKNIKYQNNPAERNWRIRDMEEQKDSSSPITELSFENGPRGGRRGRYIRRRFDEVKKLSQDTVSTPDPETNQDELSENAQSTAAASSLNVGAAPFFPQAAAPVSQNMTKLGQVKSQHGKRSGKRASHQRTYNHTDVQEPKQVSKKDRTDVSSGAASSQSSKQSTLRSTDSQIHQGEHYKPSRNQSGRSDYKRHDSADNAHRGEFRKPNRRQQNTETERFNRADNASGGSATNNKLQGRSTNADEKKPIRSQFADLHSFVEKQPVDITNIANLREYLIENLMNGSYECAICYGAVNQETAVWSCGKCYHLFHFYCIKKWANTLIAQDNDCNEWRCPTCQEKYSSLPNQYKCFCSKLRDPVWNSYDTPHSCGEVCGKKRADNCSHNCTELCHPGPCPTCTAYTSKHCNCGRSYQKVKCSKQVDVRCSLKCDKKRNCGHHVCGGVCHSGPCPPCSNVVQQVCYCGTNQREITCGSDGIYSELYSCMKECDKPLLCGNHNCTEPCHSGSCALCKTSPEVVDRCNCDKVMLSALENVVARVSCTDIIPSCDNICGKKLSCGTKSKLGAVGVDHFCEKKCHEGVCTCQLTSDVTCMCGNRRTNMPCADVMQYSAQNPYKCEKKCAKKRECGRHKCGQLCCTLVSHPCLQICGKKLTCGTHRCQELCHIGNCPTCYNVSFDELHCHCGVTIMYPPIPCGTKPPECPEICNRLHACEHPVTHRCHSDESCPPCTMLTTKLCLGKHEYRNNVPCFIKELSCGRKCEKPLPCADHKCSRTCHKDDCGDQKCRQPCPRPRAACGHPCGAGCHVGSDCSSTDCNQKVVLCCLCGNRKEEVLCYMKSKRLATSVLAVRMKELSCNISVQEMMSSMEKDQLDCDRECARLERNQRIAVALDICNPQVLAGLAGTQFTDFLKIMARKEPVFISEVERSLSELVLSSKQSKLAVRSHSFKPMKRDYRKAIHELAEHYGCKTISYDEEPNRNVVANAHRDECELPSQTLTSFIKSEKHPRPPVPIPINANLQEIREKTRRDMLSTEVKPEENAIDYFEMTE